MWLSRLVSHSFSGSNFSYCHFSSCIYSDTSRKKVDMGKRVKKHQSKSLDHWNNWHFTGRYSSKYYVGQNCFNPYKKIKFLIYFKKAMYSVCRPSLGSSGRDLFNLVHFLIGAASFVFASINSIFSIS